jgi:hypothetical protein
MVDIGRLYIIATIDWRTAPIGRFALFRALRQVTSANQAQARAGTAARRPAQITRLAATRYDLPAVPLQGWPVLPRAERCYQDCETRD